MTSVLHMCIVCVMLHSEVIAATVLQVILLHQAMVVCENHQEIKVLSARNTKERKYY